MRVISYSKVVEELDYLKVQLDLYSARIQELKMYIKRCPRILKFFFEADLEDSTDRFQKLLYRYKTLQSVKANFYKFINGITKREFKDTRKLNELLDRLKLTEIVDVCQVQIADMTTSLKDMKVRLDRVEKHIK